jgi:glycosyltransferase involved in cell wall biosynthesis
MLPLEAAFADLEQDGIRTATLGMTRGVPDPRAMLRLRDLLRRWKPDVLHGHMVHANLMVRLSRLVRSTPVVVSTLHNQDEGRQWRYLAYRLTDRLSDLTTTVSQLAVDDAVHRGAAPRGRIHLVPNGIELATYGRDPVARDRARNALGIDDGFVWLTVGRLVEAKRHEDLISAFGDVHARHPRASLLIAGVGPLEETIRTKVRDLGLDGSVDLLGLRNDVPQLMQAADAFVMSSAWEGLPMVLLEAGASSLPIAATDVGGSRDAVVDGTTGHLVPPRDPHALAFAMDRIMSLSDAGSRAMGESGRAHIARAFSLETVVDRWDALYRAALAARGRSIRPAHDPKGDRSGPDPSRASEIG